MPKKNVPCISLSNGTVGSPGTERSEWRASLSGNHTVFGVGTTYKEAVGDLVMGNRDLFNIDFK